MPIYKVYIVKTQNIVLEIDAEDSKAAHSLALLETVTGFEKVKTITEITEVMEKFTV